MPLLTSTTTSYADSFSSTIISKNNGIYRLTSPESSSRPEVTPDAPFHNLASLRNSKPEGCIRVKSKAPSPSLVELGESPKTPTNPKFPPRRSSLSPPKPENLRKLPAEEEDEFLIAPPIIIDECSERSVYFDEPLCIPQADVSVQIPEDQLHAFDSCLLKVVRRSKSKRKAPLPENRNLWGNPASLAPTISSDSAWTDDASGDGSSHLFKGVQTASISQFSSVLEPEETAKDGSDFDGLDEATMGRIMGRKHALEELVRTEEYYVQDLWSLKTYYIPLLRQCEGLSAETIASMEQTVSDLYAAHTALINDLWYNLPYLVVMPSGHLAAKGQLGGSLTTTIAAEKVARVFEEIITSFFVYEEYFLGHREIVKNPHRNQLRPELGRGLEVLTGAMNSWDNRAEYGKRALELSDMLCKPIQRLCKYPLLFREILRNTPSIDCPNTNRLLERVLHLLEEQVSNTNAANSKTPTVRSRVQQTRMLHSRLKLKGSMTLDTRRLGHVVLCGALHVTTQSTSGDIPHEYMACMLYKSYLVIATTSVAANYEVKFAIRLALAHIEKPDTGTGLYSPNAPQTWKVIFEANRCVHEVLLTASSDEEKSTWIRLMQDRIDIESTAHQEYTSDHIYGYTFIPADMKPVGELRGKPGSLARKQSLHQSSNTSVLQSNGRYIILDNMNWYSESSSPGSSYTDNAVPLISIKRADRNRAEFNLRDVWTRDLIPFSTVPDHHTKAKPPPNMFTRGLIAMKLLPTKNPEHGRDAITGGHTTSSPVKYDFAGTKKQSGSLERRFSLVRSTKSEPSSTGLGSLKRNTTRFSHWKSTPPLSPHSETQAPLPRPTASVRQKHRNSAPIISRADSQHKDALLVTKMRSTTGLEKAPVLPKPIRRHTMMLEV